MIVRQSTEVLEEARRLIGSGRAADALPSLTSLLGKKADHHGALVLLGQCLEALGRFGDAVNVYDRAIAALPGHALASTRRSLLLWRRDNGPPPASQAGDSSRPVISCTTLGRNGRFGNQLMQYAVTTLLAQVHNCEARFPDWIGRDLFGCCEPFPQIALPRRTEAELDLAAALAGPASSDYTNIDLVGYFVEQSATQLLPLRDQFRSLFEPVAAALQRANAAEKHVRQFGKTLVALHLRRGDFGTYGPDRFWVAPETWYQRWLAALWPELDDPVLYVASDDPDIVKAFQEYSPLCAADLQAPQPGAEWLEDFFILTRADALAISNSTFSAVAALLNKHCKVFSRPDRKRAVLRSYNPWDSAITDA